MDTVYLVMLKRDMFCDGTEVSVVGVCSSEESAKKCLAEAEKKFIEEYGESLDSQNEYYIQTWCVRH